MQPLCIPAWLSTAFESDPPSQAESPRAFISTFALRGRALAEADPAGEDDVAVVWPSQSIGRTGRTISSCC